MRVLFSSTSGLGHVHPMVPLARAVRDRGHPVRWATSPEACPRIADAGIDAAAAGTDSRERMAEYHRRYPEATSLVAEERVPHMFPRLFGAVTAPPLFDDLLPLVGEWRPDVIVHDAADFAAPVVAAAAGIPNVCHSFGTLVPRERVQGAADFAEPLWRRAGLEPRPYGGSYDHLYLDIYPPVLHGSDMSHVRHVQLLRPVPYDGGGGDAPLPDLVTGDEARPLVYLTFGTVFNDNPAFSHAVEGLRRLDVRLLVTVGPDGDADALGHQPRHVRVERYVPQTRVLPHCRLVASHAGSGTFLAALGLGLPQLALPQAADQFRNAEAGEKAGAALRLQGGEVDADAVAAAAVRLLEEPSFRDRAGVLAAEIAAMPSPDEVAAVVEALV